MTTDDLPDLGAVSMIDQEADDFLRERGFGVLGLADGGASYPVPISFGYDGDRAYFVYLETGTGSRKTRYSRRTERAALLAYEVSSLHDWRSVIAYGDLRRLDGDDIEPATSAVTPGHD